MERSPWNSRRSQQRARLLDLLMTAIPRRPIQPGVDVGIERRPDAVRRQDVNLPTADPASPVTTIDQAGFLSSEISSWIERHKSNPRCREWFVLAEDLNRFLQKAITVIKAPSYDSQIFNAVLLFLRGVSSFQGTVLLAERGMTNDARTLLRSCFETLFYLRAVLEDPNFVEALIRDDADRKSKLAKILLQLP
jgi:hypothetical protein